MRRREGRRSRKGTKERVRRVTIAWERPKNDERPFAKQELTLFVDLLSQRVPLSLPPRASDDLALTPSPSPSRIPRGVPLRRTRSENPRLAPTSMHSSPPSLLVPLPSSPTRELRPRTRSSTSLETTSAASSTSSSPVPAVAGVRRTRSTANSHSGSSSESTTPAPRRRTFGGLSALPEESGGDDGGSSENEERRLRRRRSTTAGASSSKGGSSGRSGLR